MRTAEEFKEQAKIKNISYWPSHNCSICNVSVGHEFKNGEASYRSACGCGWSPNHSHGWEFVAERYNRQNNPEVIRKMDAFWGFN